MEIKISKDRKRIWNIAKFHKKLCEIWLCSKSHLPSLEKSNFHSCKKIQIEEKLQV